MASNSARYHTLDHWRGIACLLVVICHSDPGGLLESLVCIGSGPIGATGVGMFFAVSGYCITASVQSARRKQTPFLAYWKRRLWRIFPPYWIACLFVGSLYVTTNALGFGLHEDIIEGWRWTPSEIVGNITLTETWRYHFFGTPDEHFFLEQAWTLCYEEQFYLLCGLGLLLTPGRYFWAAVALCGVTGITSILNMRGTIDVGGTFLAGFWLAFAAGIFAFYIIHGTRLERATSVACLMVNCAAATAMGERVIWISAASYFGVLMASLWRWDTWLDSLGAIRPVRWLGTISYSLYLTHLVVCLPMREIGPKTFPDCSWAALALAQGVGIIGSLLLAWPFHVFIERRFIPGAGRV